MCRGEREKAIIPFSDQFRPYYTMIDNCQLRSPQVSVDRVLRITRRSVDTAQAHRSWRLNAEFSADSIEAGRWHVPCSNARRFTGLFVCEGALKSPSAIFPSTVFYIFVYKHVGVILLLCGIQPLTGPLSHLRTIDEWVWSTDRMTADWETKYLQRLRDRERERERETSPGATWYPINQTQSTPGHILFILYSDPPLLCKTYKEHLICFHLTATKCTFCPCSSV